jgi:hypothetical protein
LTEFNIKLLLIYVKSALSPENYGDFCPVIPDNGKIPAPLIRGETHSMDAMDAMDARAHFEELWTCKYDTLKAALATLLAAMVSEKRKLDLAAAENKTSADVIPPDATVTKKILK